MKKRKDCVFGMHFDFHARPDESGLGGDFRLDDYERMLDEVKPDVIQVDTKGHPGIASYPTELGNAAPDMKGDMLKQLRRITSARGVLLFSHYSGVWDVFQTQNHPEYKAVFVNDIEYKGETSVFSDYAEKLLIPQLCELAEKYGMDGVWIDGECWATQADKCDAAVAAYRKKFGEQPDFENKREQFEYFCRDAFYEYVKNYTSAVHRKYPNFEIASNWLGTTFCPRSDGLGVDFITGDYDPYNSVNTARFQSKALVRQANHWELLSWGFNVQNGYIADKSVAQIKQEVTAIYNCGGAVSLYYTAIRGNIKSYLLPIWKEVARFSKEVGGFTKGEKVIPEIAVLQSEKGFYKHKKRLFSTWEDEYASDLEWLTIALSDLGIGVEVAFGQTLREHLNEYSVVVVPDFPDIESDIADMLVAYAQNGGKVLLAGQNAVKLFADRFGFEISGEYAQTCFAVFDGERLGITQPKLILGGESSVEFYDNYLDGSPVCAAMQCKPFGKGRVCAVPFALGKHYAENRSGACLKFLERALAEMQFSPLIRALSHYKVDMVPAKKGSKLFVNLLNLLGSHADKNVREEEYIPPLHDVKVEVSARLVYDITGGKPFTVSDREGNIYAYCETGGTITVEGVDVEIQKTLIFG